MAQHTHYQCSGSCLTLPGTPVHTILCAAALRRRPDRSMKRERFAGKIWRELQRSAVRWEDSALRVAVGGR